MATVSPRQRCNAYAGLMQDKLCQSLLVNCMYACAGPTSQVINGLGGMKPAAPQQCYQCSQQQSSCLTKLVTNAMRARGMPPEAYRATGAEPAQSLQQKVNHLVSPLQCSQNRAAYENLCYTVLIRAARGTQSHPDQVCQTLRALPDERCLHC